MKHLVLLTLALALPVTAIDALASKSPATGASPKAAATRTITGEVVDTGCYLGHEARGADHVACAKKCIAKGMPMGLLAADGTLYLLTMDHADAGPYNELKDMAGETVSVTGALAVRGGMKGLDVVAVKRAAAPAGK
jgi:hypothetical protein